MDECVGHHAFSEFFSRLIDRQALSHAYLVVGPEHVGKTTFIRQVIQQLLQVPEERLLTHPDVSWVTRLTDEKTGNVKQTLSVEQIRALRSDLAMGALLGGYRVAVIEDADCFTTSSANALLKILEEPPKRTILFLRAERVEDVPQTIASRTEVIRLSLVPHEEVVKTLVMRGASKDEAVELARVAAGRPGLALHFLTDRAAYTAWRTHRTLFEAQLNTSLSDRMAYARNLTSSKPGSGDHAEGDLIFAVWETVLRDQLRSDPKTERWRQALERLEESRNAFARHTSLQLAFEHTLLHL